MGALEELREQMKEAGLSAYVIPTNDPHFCEMPPSYWARRKFLTGFTGSAGTAVVTMKEALLWTDARYYLQAGMELSDQWQLIKYGMPGVPQVHEWLAANVESGGTVGLDPLIFSIKEADRMREALEAKHIKLALPTSNLVDPIWKEGRPELCRDPVRLHPLEYAGLTAEAKLRKIADEISEKEADAILVTKLDDVAWVLNIRAADVPNTPLFVSYLIVRKDGTATIYCDEERLGPDVRESLAVAQVDVAAYERAIPDIRVASGSGQRFWLDPASTSVAAHEAAIEGFGEQNAPAPKPKLEELPIALMKSKKIQEEMDGMRLAYIKDGANWAKFLCWLEETVSMGNTPTEIEVAEHLEVIRRQMDAYIGPSFETISGFGENGAIIHYRPLPETTAAVTAEKVFLCDAGCQFVEGTTDITRTVHLGQPKDWERECWTRVLKGHIAFDSTIFPQGTCGFALDAFARRALWTSGIDYRHGTGHGVGAALCVHEGPHGVSFRGNTVPLEAGMVLSNEPGYYEAGAFGIRIESVIAVTSSDVGENFLEFENLTFVPLQQRMLDLGLLTEEECDWVDAYHQKTWKKVSPLLEGKPRAWLEKATAPIDRTGMASKLSARFEKRRAA